MDSLGTIFWRGFIHIQWSCEDLKQQDQQKYTTVSMFIVTEEHVSTTVTVLWCVLNSFQTTVEYHLTYPSNSHAQRRFIWWQIQTDTFAGVSRRVGVSLVALAAEGAVRVLAEAVVPTDGLIDTLINICGARAHREVSETLIFTAARRTIASQTAAVNTAPLFQNKHPRALQ